MNFMRKFVFCLVLLAAAGAGSVLYSQPPPPPPAKAKPVRVVGKAEVHLSPERDRSAAWVHVFLLGTQEDIQKKKDVLTLFAAYQVPGPKTVQPKKMEFSLSWLSPSEKPEAEHTLTLIADDKTLLSIEVSPSHPVGPDGPYEYYYVQIDYAAYKKFANARNAVLKLGTTTIDLTPDMAQALKDLDATIER